ncbi:PREDICTED: uncharacterized protein LOC104612634 [Nelumbo nucifera]|uniref:Uncharacterized protein LOC104612634 n=1 Tax=Nelumbo nucifera TaxID=4432 RepID=A0A1U8BMZ6_NELNU|nr:PREDICTED: uncharacterized protein LOC104612634 [Nelumbo nucifera]
MFNMIGERERKAEDRELANGGAAAAAVAEAEAEAEAIEDICSLCGDVGFRDALVLCRKCGFRLQHTYCSRLYPEIDTEKWSCEWCLHEEEKRKESKRRRSKVFEFLLEIAQSLPERDNNPSPTSPSRNDDKRICRQDDRFAASGEKRFHVASTETTREKEKDKEREEKEKPSSLKKNSTVAAARCSEKNKALDRWRNLAKTKLGCRRYKLLADVHC